MVTAPGRKTAGEEKLRGGQHALEPVTGASSCTLRRSLGDAGLSPFEAAEKVLVRASGQLACPGRGRR